MEGVIPSGCVPQVNLMNLSVKSSTSERAEVNVFFEITNPHHLPVDVDEVEFEFGDEEQQVVVKKVQQRYLIQGCSSKSMEVPLELDYREFTGGVVPSAMRAELSFRQAMTGVFKVSIDKVKHLLSVLEQRESPQVERVSGYVNGMHISSLSPTQAGFTIVLRVSNGNPIPVRLDKASFTLESSKVEGDGAQVLVEKVVEARQSIPGRSQKRVEIPLTIKFEELPGGVLPKPGGDPLAFKLKMDFWFVDSTHGAYKISQEKSGSLPLLAPAMVGIKEVSFERSDGGVPEAKMMVQLMNSVPAGFKLTRLNYGIRFVDENKGGEVARAGVSEVELELAQGSLFDVVVEPVVESVFGSALWDVFSDKMSTFKADVSVEGKSPEFGMITM